MALFNQVTIIGVGLIGGSLAKAIRSNHVAKTIVGFFRNKRKKEKAVRSRLVNKGFLTIKESIQKSELIILALPVNQIIQHLAKLKKIVTPRQVIIDIGSTKASVVAAAEKLHLNFLGTHPMAGSEKRGAEHCSKTLFDNSLAILTPTTNTSPYTLKKIRSFWKQLNATTTILSPKSHDRIIARTSHLPHVVAFSLMNAIPERYLDFGASGLKDTTRIALSEAHLWSDILSTNKKEVLTSITGLEREIKRIKKALLRKKSRSLVSALDSARKKREAIN